MLTALSGLTAVGAAADPPAYQITGQWAPNTPTTVAKGDVVTSVWRVNVNDPGAAPANSEVQNVTFTVALTHGTFKALPDGCETSGVTPASSISSDGATLTCNLGTQKEGTAAVIQAPVIVNGATGDKVSAIGTIDGKSASIPQLTIDNPFGMDMLWGAPTSSVTHNADSVDVDFEWTLNLKAGSDPGPDTVSYDLTVEDIDGSTTNVGPQGCSAFADGAATGHPWSGGSHPADEIAPFVKSCTLTKTGPTTFTLTLAGIDYSQADVPTKDSTGTPLPTDQAAVASGSVWFRIATTTRDSVSLSANAPTYQSADKTHSAQDDPSNNTSTKTITQPGGFTEAWNRSYTGAGGTPHDNTYQVSPGATVQARAVTGFGALDAGEAHANSTYGLCQVLDTRYVTYDSWLTTFPVKTGIVAQYYTGADPTVTPGSNGYDPNSFDCGITTGWTSTAPADKSTVKAVRITYPFSDLPPQGNTYFGVQEVVKANVKPGQDVWTWGSDLEDGGPWLNQGRQMTPPGQTDVPGGRYPFTTGARDVLHIVALTPALSKSVANPVIKPGTPDTFTLDYSANGSGASGTVDDYTIVDTLPDGLSYVPGSATPAPTVNGQKLTWTLDDVSVNTTEHLSYKATVSPSAVPGQTLTNSAVATVQGHSSPAATAEVTVPTAGFTMIVKTANGDATIPNDGTGNGSGSWTVTLTSQDPLAQQWTDTIDVLPYNGDGRGTKFSGSYSLGTITAVSGATVYYTTADPGSISQDPNAVSNGSADHPSSLWTTTRPADAGSITAIRVIGPSLAPGATQKFTVPITTSGAQGGDKFVNVAEASTSHTRLYMRTSAALTVAAPPPPPAKGYFTFDKVANPTSGSTVDPGQKVAYTVTITQHGPTAITNASIDDDMTDVIDDATYNKDAKASSGRVSYAAPTLTWTGDLAVGQTVTITYTVTVTADGNDKLANTVTTTDPLGSCDTTVGCATHHVITTPPTPDPTPGPSSTPQPPTAGSPSGTGLAVTGSDVWPPLALTFLLLLVGGGAVLLNARRRRG